MRYHFEDAILDLQYYELRRQGQRVKLRRKVFDLLAYLIAQRERVVSKAELHEHLWPGHFITDATLASCIMEARQAIGDRRRPQRIIQTLHSRGYRFIAVLEVQGDEATDSTVQSAQPPLPDTRDRGDAAGSPAILPLTPAVSAVSRSPHEALPQVAQDVLVSEYKPVTVLVGALVEAAEQAASLDHETLHSRQQAFFSIALDTIQQYGGTIQQMHAGRVLAVFGVPTVHEDHARRAVLAAVELCRRLHEPHVAGVGPPDEALAVRLGVHTGQVVVGSLGEAPHLTITAVGDTLDMADQLQGNAAPGMILLSEATLQRVQSEVQVEALALSAAPGQTAPRRAYRLCALRPWSTALVRHGVPSLSPFVGRTPELVVWQARWAQVEAGRGQVIGVVGEPGMGKSRLLHEFLQQVGPTQVAYLEGRCLPHSHATPYFPLLAILRHAWGLTEADSIADIEAKVVQWFQAVGMVPEVWAPLLLPLLGVPGPTDRLTSLTPQAVKTCMVEILWQLSVHRSRQCPLILVVEDVQWIDATSDECLALLAQRLARVPLVLLVTYRPGYCPAWLDKSYAVQLALTPLDTQASRIVLQTVLAAAPVSDPLMQMLLRTAEGNPFFLEELARAVLEQGASAPRREVPATLQAVLLARLDRLSSEARRLVQIAAVIGKEGSVPLLQTLAALPTETFQQCLEHLQAAELLYAIPWVHEPRYTFTHALTHEVAYRALLTRTRQQLHRQIAQVMVEQFPSSIDTQPELVAHHYTEAGLRAAAVRHWQQAAQRALARSAPVEASTHAQRGLALLAALPTTPARRQQALSLHLARAVALTATQGYAAPEVEQAYLRALAYCDQAGDVAPLFTALRGLWLVYLVRGEIHTAEAHGARLLGLAQQHQDPTLLLEAHRTVGTSRFFAGHLEAAWTHLAQGIALYETQQHDALLARYGQDPGLVCLVYAAWLLWLRGSADQASTCLHTALTLVQQCWHPFCLAFAHTFAVMISQCQRNFAAVSRHLEVCLPLAQQQGFPLLAAMGAIFRGWVRAECGQGDEGIAHMRQGFAAYQATGATLSQPYFLGLLAEAYGRHGQIDTALETLTEALALVDTTGEQVYAADLYWHQGELLRQMAGGALAAEACWLQALDVSRRQGAKAWELRAALSLSRLWQQQGKHLEAHGLLTDVYAWFTEGHDTADLRETQALLEELRCMHA